MNLSLNHTAAEIAAAALFELFPGIELLGGRLTSIGFAYDFRSAHRLPPETESLIEEKMRQIVREKRPVKTFEMVPFSARELLLKEGHRSRADQLDESGLVEIVQIGSFTDLSPGGPHLSNAAQLAAFKLWPIQDAGDGELRLAGCAFPSKDELKQFLKRLRAYPEKSHVEFGKILGCWRLVDGQFVWLAPGLQRQRELIETLRGCLFQGAQEVAFPDREAVRSLSAALAAEMGKPLVLAEVHAEPRAPWDPETGLLAGEGGSQICLRCFGSPQEWREKLISSLQMTGKTLNILGFEHRLRLRGRKRSDRGVQALLEAAQGEEVELEFVEEKCTPRLDFLVDDNLGRQWEAFSIDWAADSFLVKASVERLVALLLERSLSGTSLSNEKTTNGEQH